jgi:hypothetical protein
MFETVSLEAVLIFSRGVLLIGACGVLSWAIVRWRRQLELDARRLFEQMDLALVELRTVQEIVQRLESRLATLAGQVEAGSRAAPPATGAAARGYELAVRLAKRGAPVDEIVSTCGITRHEAELLVRLHNVRVADTLPPGGREDPAAARKPAMDGRAPATEPAPAAPRRKGSLFAVG